MISVVVLAFNEASNLPRCLGSVAWCDDVLVVDSGSSDGTVDIARSRGARVVVRPFDSFARQRNHAMEHGGLRHGWTLHLDADETVDAALRDELQALALDPATQFPVYRIPSRMIFMGRWLRHAGMYPAYQVRFGKTGRLRFVDHGHGQREDVPAAEVGTVHAAFDHYNFSKGFNDWVARHLRYAREEALQVEGERATAPTPESRATDPTSRRRALKTFSARLPLRPLLRFLYVYVLRAGFLDGKPGFHYAVQMGVYQYFIDRNRAELRVAK